MKKGTVAASDIEALLLKKVKEIKDRKLLPNGYAKRVVQLVLDKAAKDAVEVKCTVNNVNQVVAGNSKRLDIIEAILELAEMKREKDLIARADKLLEGKL